MDEVLLFANPIAGRGRGRGIAALLIDHLTRRRVHVRAFLDPADQLPDDVFRASAARAAIIIGGDGTLRAVTMRFYAVNAAAAPQVKDQKSKINTEIPPPLPIPPLLIVPLGTANLMGRHLGIAWDDQTLPQRLIHAIRQHHVIHLDAAAANGGLFLLMAGVGVDALVVHELNRLRHGPITLFHYALPTALAFQQYQFEPITVTVDGATMCRDLPALAFVGNIPEYGTGFPVLPLARADDGLLDVCILPCRSRRELIQVLLLVASGEHPRAEGVLYVKGRHVRVESHRPVPVQVDGEPAGHTPLTIELLPWRIPFIVPAEHDS